MAHFSADDAPEKIAQCIDHEYEVGDHKFGWSYLYSALSSRLNPELVTIGLNPGGGDELHDWHSERSLSFEDHGAASNAYFDQSWGVGTITPLQEQIQQLISLHFPTVVREKILSFQFVPFRSPSWAELGSPDQATRLGGSLLNWTLGHITTQTTVVVFGCGAVRERIEQWFDVLECEEYPTGWGKISASLCKSPKCKKLVFLPHLSRYQIIGRPEFMRSQELFA